jgi:hypothetical protein
MVFSYRHIPAEDITLPDLTENKNAMNIDPPYMYTLKQVKLN